VPEDDAITPWGQIIGIQGRPGRHSTTGMDGFQTGTSIGRPLRDAASLETILPEALADLLRDFLLG